MDTLNERLERFAELQKKNLAPLNGIGDSAFAAFERVARKNYELMGDMVEYAVAQSRGTLEQRSPQALYEHQMAEAKAFAERMGARAAEYAALAEAMRPDDFPAGAQAAGGTPSAARSTKDGNASVVPSKAVDKPSSAKPASVARAAGGSTPGKAAAKKKAAATTGRKSGSTSKASGKAAVRKTAAKKTTAKAASGKKAAGKKTSAKKRSARSRSAG